MSLSKFCHNGIAEVNHSSRQQTGQTKCSVCVSVLFSTHKNAHLHAHAQAQAQAYAQAQAHAQAHAHALKCTCTCTYMHIPSDTRRWLTSACLNAFLKMHVCMCSEHIMICPERRFISYTCLHANIPGQMRARGPRRHVSRFCV